MDNTLIIMIVASLAGGVLSLSGGVILAMSHNRGAKSSTGRHNFAEYATAFAAGSLLAAAFFDLLHEGLESSSEPTPVLLATLLGIIIFFFCESSFHWFHHHRHHESGDKHNHPHSSNNASLIVVSDTIHNALDGIAIAAAFSASLSAGLLVILAVAAHELPQEIGDFALLLQKGLHKNKVILINIISSLATTITAIIFFLLGEAIEIELGPVLGVVAGFFIYIAVSDIIPSIHSSDSQSALSLKSVLLLLGVIFVGVSTTILHSFIG